MQDESGSEPSPLHAERGTAQVKGYGASKVLSKSFLLCKEELEKSLLLDLLSLMIIASFIIVNDTSQCHPFLLGLSSFLCF